MKLKFDQHYRRNSVALFRHPQRLKNRYKFRALLLAPRYHLIRARPRERAW
jgi:hypothetical protein